MDVEHVSNKRVRLLFNDHGPEGYWIWACLLAHAYQIEGYYHKFEADDVDLFAADLCHRPPELVYKVVESCIRRGLFDKRVFEKCNVLTNDRMQINYIKATYERRRKGSNTQFHKDHFILTHEQLKHIGGKFLENIFFYETQAPIYTGIEPSTEGRLFSAEDLRSDAERNRLDAENRLSSKLKREKEKETIKDTNVSPSSLTRSGNVGIKDSTEDEIQGSAKRSKPGPKKKVAQKKKARNPDAEPYWDLIRRKWIDFNLQHLRFNPDPMPKGDYSCMHRIIEKLRERAANQGIEWSETNALDRWEKFLTVSYTGDKWLHDNFDLKCLEAKQQVVYQIIDNVRPAANLNGSIVNPGKPSSSDARIERLKNW